MSVPSLTLTAALVLYPAAATAAGAQPPSCGALTIPLSRQPIALTEQQESDLGDAVTEHTQRKPDDRRRRPGSAPADARRAHPGAPAAIALDVTTFGDRADIFAKYRRLVERDRGVNFGGKHHERQQSEADQVALMAVARTGYSPTALIDWWDRFAETEGRTVPSGPRFVRFNATGTRLLVEGADQRAMVVDPAALARP